MTKSNPTVGVAPGTITMCLGDSMSKILTIANPFVSGSISLGGLGGLGAFVPQSRIHWGLLGVVGGGALVVSLLAGLVANAVGGRSRA